MNNEEESSVTKKSPPRTPAHTPSKPLSGSGRPALTGITNFSTDSLPTSPRININHADATPSEPSLPGPSRLSPSAQTQTVYTIELEYDPAPGPFVRIRHMKRDGHGEIVAGRELDVTWVRGKSCGRILALKVFEKKVIVEKKLEQAVMNELRAYQTLALKDGSAGMAFVARLGGSFEAPEHIVFASDYMQRDLSEVLQGRNYEREECKKQWIAQLILGLSAIHKAGLINGDIKPQNILLDANNNVRISGFGNAFVNRWSTPLAARERCSTKICGTWPYMAPEMLQNAGKPEEEQEEYTIAVDYWSLGCVAYELEAETPKPLFRSLGDVTLYDLYGPGGDPYPPFAGMSEEAQSLIFGLVCVDVATRLDDRKLRRHPYFSSASGSDEFKKWNKFRVPRTLSDVRWVEPDHDHTSRPIVYRPVNLSDTSTSAPPPPAGESDFAQFRWIHPKGIWAVAGARRHILYRS